MCFSAYKLSSSLGCLVKRRLYTPHAQLLVPFKPRCAPVRVVRTHVTSPDIALYQTRGRGISTTRQLVCVKASQRRSADLSDFPCSLQAALHNVAAVAEPSSSCPPKALTALATAQRALGGCFFLVSCGQYSSDHPQAGKPAHALLHLVLLAVRRAAAGSSSPYSIKGEPMVVSAVQDVHLAPDTLACVVAYELGSNGQPTGAAYNSASAFEHLTTKRHYLKPLASCRIVSAGAEISSVQLYVNRQLKTQGVAMVPSRLRYMVLSWCHEQLSAAGISVIMLHESSSSSSSSSMDSHSSRKIHLPDGPLVVYTDGSALDNCKAGIGVVFPALPLLDVSAPVPGHGSSIIAELAAMEHACRMADDVDPEGEKALEVNTDSHSLIDAVQQLDFWKNNGWRKASGGMVKNLDLVQKLWQHAQRRSFIMKYVKGHSGNKWNEKADRLAREGAEAARMSRL